MTFSSNTFRTMSRGLTGGCASTDSPPAAIRTLTVSQPATAALLDSLAAAVKGTAPLPEHTPALALLFCWLALSLVWTGHGHGAGWAGWEQRFAGAGVGLGAETGLSMAGLGRAGMAEARLCVRAEGRAFSGGLVGHWGGCPHQMLAVAGKEGSWRPCCVVCLVEH